MEKKLAIVDFIKFNADDAPYLEAQKCTNCDSVFFDTRPACAKCFSRDSLKTVRPTPEGSLYAYTIVRRSFPNVVTPFIHAVVDLVDGGTIRGTLRGVSPNPEDIKMGTNVDIVFEDVGETADKTTKVIGYSFYPTGEQSQ
jgi:uncharacterized protein